MNYALTMGTPRKSSAKALLFPIPLAISTTSPRMQSQCWLADNSPAECGCNEWYVLRIHGCSSYPTRPAGRSPLCRLQSQNESFVDWSNSPYVVKECSHAEGVRKISRFTQVPYWLYIGSTWRRYFGKKCRRCDFGGFGR